MESFQSDLYQPEKRKLIMLIFVIFFITNILLGTFNER